MPATFHGPEGNAFTLALDTGFPVNGSTALSYHAATAGRGVVVMLRIPGWIAADTVTVTVKTGAGAATHVSGHRGSYLRLPLLDGDVIEARCVCERVGERVSE